MTPILEQVMARVLTYLDSSVSRWIIAIVGGIPGAGKSTLAARLANEVNRSTKPNTLVALGMDGFHLTKDELCRFPNPAKPLRGGEHHGPLTQEVFITVSANCVMPLVATMLCDQAFSTRWAIRSRLPTSFRLLPAW